MKNYLFILLCPLVLLFTCMNTQASVENQQNGIRVTTLTSKQYFFAEIASLTASGNENVLKMAVDTAIENGITINEIKDVMVQLYAYCGFPRSLNALSVLNLALEERHKQGKLSIEGRASTPLPEDTDMLKLGTKTQTQVVGMPVNIAISSDIDRYLKTHLFGDIFSSDLLTYQEREIVTVAALASMSNVEPQLIAHFNVSRNTGITNEQLQEVITIVSKYNKTLGERARHLLIEGVK